MFETNVQLFVLKTGKECRFGKDKKEAASLHDQAGLCREVPNAKRDFFGERHRLGKLQRMPLEFSYLKILELLRCRVATECTECIFRIKLEELLRWVDLARDPILFK